MSKLQDEVNILRQQLAQVELPPALFGRVSDNLDEITRLESDITARVYIEKILRYLDWIINLPWKTRTQDVLDLVKAQDILNRNHYGLEPVKERILEYLAVLKLNQDRFNLESKVNIDGQNGEIVTDNKSMRHAVLARRAPILCLVGLVGTGKTTLAKSIAQAMGRRFVRIPFGGLSDALDLRGQSRVRPDAEIGLIMKGLRFAGTKNPVMLLDEIDRVAEHDRGDIMGVLVELLDPEQNSIFTDHYLDYPFDLSEVLFVATANNTTNIATAVMDRLESIQMPSYTDDEKIKIAKDYVMPQLLQASGLTADNLKIDDVIWPKLVRPLGYDSGIRSLERILNSICRKVAKRIVEGKGNSFIVDADTIKDFIQTY
jgi:ATP-dependent Lon protease